VYEAEKTTNFEGGVKSQLFDRRLMLNLAVFSTSFENQQIQLLDINTGQQGIVNIPKTRNRGVELDMTARPTSQLTLSGGVGYLDSVITRFGAQSIVEGNRPPYSPEWTYNFAVDYTQPVANDWDLLLRAAVTGQAGMSYEYFSRERNFANLGYLLQKQPGYALVDLRATLRNPDWAITAFTDNAFDKKYYADAASNLITGFGDIALRGRTRRYGVEVSYSF
jgi:iron complex outermembrane receptor protein